LTLAVEAEMSHGRHFGNMIGPNTDRGHLAATAETFVKLQPFLVHGGMLDIKTQIISPTIVCKPLRHGPQLTEFFAPVIMLQEYSDERELSAYFGHPRYGPNAMYVTIFGQSQLRIDSLSELEVHPPETVLRNKNLHEEEKGTRPYGGYGSEASFVWFAGIKRPTPILPPREIHQYLVARQNGGDIGQDVITQKAQTARDARFQRLKRLKTFNVTIYPPHYIPTARCRDLAYRYGKLGNGEITADRVVVAGRVVAYRNSGMFIDLRDTSGKIQILSEESQLEHMLEVMKLIDLGDLIGVEGSIRRTKRGELTIAADKLTLLAKDLMRPQKDHGAQFADGASQRSVKDPDSPIEPQHHFLARSQTLASVRKLMSSHDFHDVETAFLEPNPSASPVFELDVATSVSSSVLSLVAKGLCDRAYEILRHIGNRGADMRESIIVDTVQAFGNWHDMMTLTERQIEFVTQNLLEAGLVADGAVEVPSRFPRESLLSLIERETGFEFAQVESDEWTRQRAKALGCGIRGKETWGQCVTSVFLDKVVPKLITPIHVTHLPIAISHAAVADPQDARLAERFVTYINGQLISSGFTLLSDPFVHNERTSLSIGWEVPKGYGTEGWAQDFTAIIEQGLPPTAVLRTNLGRLVGLVTKRNIEPRAA
ncbi:MAG: OB-fold nucleic acid binding domain-containing protein, partial [Candidatus Sulfotelmatobacter sp.]